MSYFKVKGYKSSLLKRPSFVNIETELKNNSKLIGTLLVKPFSFDSQVIDG